MNQNISKELLLNIIFISIIWKLKLAFKLRYRTTLKSYIFMLAFLIVLGYFLPLIIILCAICVLIIGTITGLILMKRRHTGHFR